MLSWEQKKPYWGDDLKKKIFFRNIANLVILRSVKNYVKDSKIRF